MVILDLIVMESVGCETVYVCENDPMFSSRNAQYNMLRVGKIKETC